MRIRQVIYLLLGPGAVLVLWVMGRPETMTEEAFAVLCVTVWMASWWVTEAVPIAVTALLPIVLFPMTGAMDIASTTAAFGHKYVFLYLGGFVLAIAIERWGLHRRVALFLIHLIGTNVQGIVLGFMVATAFLSMWISNTATSVMMLPIGMAIVSQFKHNAGEDHPDTQRFGKVLMLAIAYSASIGGVATLIGTPPNLVLAGVLEQTYGVKLSFFQWLQLGLPISVLLLVICWCYLTHHAFRFSQKSFPGGREEVNRMRGALGRMSTEEKRVLVVFVLTASAWMFRSLLQRWVPALDDTIIAMIAALVLFVIPAGSENRRLIVWEEAVKLPWGIILLFGGGMALAKGFAVTGLAQWIAAQMTQLDGVSLLVLILILVTMVNFLTEVTSNLATTAMLLPVLAPMALAFDLHPLMIMVPVTIAASCAFMLPVATPPNAVVFGAGYLQIKDMLRAGIWLNLLSVLLITLFVYFLLPHVWGIDPHVFPVDFMRE
ncbi:anion transporter [Reichenbachiella sp. 5M10]|nr:SLC13 family permease [Reichenbachiella sp. 5M10]PIB37359.1 anion transporter [Reichenbachiella sp. 5M10]